ncbi:Rv0361 family membrane protein [Micromonospora sp. NBC_01699]|uniref:Rv0361 family membrane protein n=1 Tax=Micromonospora sp. NBC_01699 TaxID=2975984 RepID=UPI003FA5B7AC
MSGQPYPGQPVSGQPYPGQPVSGQPYAGTPYPGQPFPGPAQFGQPGYPPPPGYPLPAQLPRKKRGLLIASIVLAVAVVLCGGGGLAAFLVLRSAETGQGAPSATAAVDGFLKAVYTEKDADKAASLVCSQANDRAAVVGKVDEVKKLSQTYKTPRFKWNPPKVDEQADDRAIVSVQLTMTTADEKTAEQQLKFTVIQKTGWRVCEVG